MAQATQLNQSNQSLSFKYGPGMGANTKDLNIEDELQTLKATKQVLSFELEFNPKDKEIECANKNTTKDLIDFQSNLILQSHKEQAANLTILIPKNKTLNQPIELTLNSDKEEIPTHTANTLTFVAEENSSTHFVISQSSQSHKILQSTVIQVIAKKGSNINITTNNLSSTQINFIHTQTLLEEGAQVILTDDLTHNIQPNNNNSNEPNGSITNAFTYLRSSQTLKGQHANAQTFTALTQKETQQLDIKTDMNHLADNTSANMLARGIVLDDAKVSYQGTIHIPQNTNNTNSHQNFKALTLGDKAKCDAVPVLDVHNDNVSVSHGAALGRIDEEQLFYLQSKGMPKQDAINMITQGFLNHALQHANNIQSNELEGEDQ